MNVGLFINKLNQVSFRNEGVVLVTVANLSTKLGLV